MNKKDTTSRRICHPTEGYAYEYDMTPQKDYDAIIRIEIPKDRFLNDDELWELFLSSHRITAKNIEIMKKWDSEHNRPDRFVPHHNGMSIHENLKMTNSLPYNKQYKLCYYYYLIGKISKFDYDFICFKFGLLEKYLWYLKKNKKD